MDFNSLLGGIKKWIVPEAPPAPQPMQQGQIPASYPGYERTVTPGDIDTAALGRGISNVGNNIGQFLGGLIPDFIGGAPAQAEEPLQIVSPQPSATPQATRMPQMTPQPSAPPSNLEEVIRKGFEAYGNPPAATLSAEFARAGEGLPDPLMPAIMSIKESSGGRNLTHPNNIMNIFDPRGKDYPSPEANIAGEKGDGRWSFKELLNEGSAYGKYRDSQQLEDFFGAYSPATDPRNGTIDEQIAKYNQYRKYFEPYL